MKHIEQTDFEKMDDVASRFAKAHHQYATHAVIQKKVAAHLIQLMDQHLSSHQFDRVLEIGCGTGYLTQLFDQNFKVETLFLNDLYDVNISELSLSCLTKWCVGKIEHIQVPASLDLCISSSALQWIDDLEHVFQRLNQQLNSNAYFCFSTYGKNNFKEIKSLTGQGLEYLDATDIHNLLSDSGFEILHIEQKTHTLNFTHPKLILKHIQATGVSATNPSFRWTKQSLQDFYVGYRQFVTTDDQENLVYPLTYDPIYVIARRKP